MIIVADTSPLIYLARLGQLDILQQLYGNVIIPTEVWRELVAKQHSPERAALLRAATWLHVDPSADASPLLAEIQEGMDNGEAAAVIAVLRPVLEVLQATNFRADPKLYRRALEQVGGGAWVRSPFSLPR